MNLFQLMKALEYIRGIYGDQLAVEIHPLGDLTDFDYFDAIAVSRMRHAERGGEVVLIWSASYVAYGLGHDSPYAMVVRFTDDQMEVAVRPEPVKGQFTPVKEP